ncbi:hypothetical protein H0X06_06000 [Candidatus Dependentiae bacterium]|nr:hypothetical protein [Candidatus Dependentiae bacterium]
MNNHKTRVSRSLIKLNVLLKKLMKNIQGKVYGDKGYFNNNELFQKLYFQGIHLISKIRRNMRNSLMDKSDKLVLRKSGRIESVLSLY